MPFDLFGSEFKFTTSKGREKQTTKLGQLFSLLIVGVALAYLIFLMYEFVTMSSPPNKLASLNNKIKCFRFYNRSYI